MSSPTENLMATIEEIRSGEGEAMRLREEARQKADALLKKAREDALQVARTQESEIIAFRDAHTREGRKIVEEEVQRILAKAEKEAVRIRVQRLDKKELEKLVAWVLDVKEI